MLNVSFCSFTLQNNVFADCVVNVDAPAGNAYGGGISLYIGGYSSVSSSNGNAFASVGDTLVRNVSVTLQSARFKSCVARRSGIRIYGANVYGGSFSFYIGAYTWSRGDSGNSSSAPGATDVRGVVILVQNISSFDSRSLTKAFNTSQTNGHGASAYGGSISVLYVGSYSLSSSSTHHSTSTCEETLAREVWVHVSDISCVNCSASSTSTDSSYGANSYGGSMSVVYIGAYAWSVSDKSSSICAHTYATEISVHVRNTSCYNCSASISSGQSYGANSYGGSMSVLHIGAYAWSLAPANGLLHGFSSSACGESIAKGVLVHVSNSECSNCRALSTTSGIGRGMNSYGGLMSIVFIGAYAWSFSFRSRSSSVCDDTSASGVSVNISNLACSNCSAWGTSSDRSFGANSYGGSISARIGAYSYSYGDISGYSRSYVEHTLAQKFSVSITNATVTDSEAMSGEHCSTHIINDVQFNSYCFSI